ncbi:uncharacterized protein [Elaeis guineensis]|uniref:Uncharacterized protein LOC105034647 isoform X3 n=1 Tax=Elaeis guineensis var. tenera TaxID=51953 RepID=A0A8N4I646_ELAGV|nr:uncharacterized protein LOC105034647 isoform X3 [Elaeis guineensis]
MESRRAKPFHSSLLIGSSAPTSGRGRGSRFRHLRSEDSLPRQYFHWQHRTLPQQLRRRLSGQARQRPQCNACWRLDLRVAKCLQQWRILRLDASLTLLEAKLRSTCPKQEFEDDSGFKTMGSILSNLLPLDNSLYSPRVSSESLRASTDVQQISSALSFSERSQSQTSSE